MGAAFTESAEPVHLRTLGTTALAGGEPQAAVRVTAQPKRLALLVFLAARAPGERLTRDRVQVTFWPELPTTRAQGSLRNAVYFLRRNLGARIVESGGSHLWVPPEHLRCDAASLLTDDPRLDGAAVLDLYRGDFLDGVHVSGAPDFERWVDRTRAALRARAAQAAWELSERAERAREWITAARYGRRATELAVDVEAAAQRLISLLGRAGDRGAALREFARLEAHLEQEFGVEPSSETAALVDRLRQSTVVPGPPDTEERAPAWPQRPSSLAILPFEDLSEPPAPYLAGGLCDDLLTALSRVRGVRIVSRTSVRGFQAEPPASMRAVHELLGVDLALEGSVRLRGDRVRVNVQLVDAPNDSPIWAHAFDSRFTDIFRVQSEVALRIARALETELSPREHRRLRQAPTSSVPAYQLYLLGRAAWSRRRPELASRAADLFRQALELDPDFHLASVGLADAESVRAAVGAESFREAGRTNRRIIDRVLARDPELGEAWATRGLIHTFFEPDASKAETAYRRAIELSPGYATAHQWFGNWLASWGREALAIERLDWALDLDPFSPAVNESRGLALFHLGRLDEAEDDLRRTLELDPEYWRARLSLAHVHAAQGRPEEAAAELMRVWAAGAFGADVEEAREARRLADAGNVRALEFLLDRLRSRPLRVAAMTLVEVLVLALLERPTVILEALQESHDHESLGLHTLYAPTLDRLASDPRFRDLVAESGMMLPRWQ